MAQETIKDDSVEEVEIQENPDGSLVYTKAQFKELIEAYKVQNPKKYAMKKDALEAQLKALK